MEGLRYDVLGLRFMFRCRVRPFLEYSSRQKRLTLNVQSEMLLMSVAFVFCVGQRIGGSHDEYVCLGMAYALPVA